MSNEYHSERINLEELKCIQLDILEHIHEFCIDHDIKYSLACGSLLGAVRHKGYIPWDDDIDIYLLRNDYEKLMRLFPVVYKEYYQLVSMERSKEWNRAYAKAFDNRTVMHENASYSYKIGVNIDIFPIDSAPDAIEEWISYNRRRLFLQHLYELKMVSLNTNRNIFKNLCLLCGKIFLFFISIKVLARLIDLYARVYNKRESMYVFENVQGIRLKNRFKKECFKETVLYPFENHFYLGMKNYDEYLSNAYGNYMKLPPLEKRQTHHVFDAFWK